MPALDSKKQKYEGTVFDMINQEDPTENAQTLNRPTQSLQGVIRKMTKPLKSSDRVL